MTSHGLCWQCGQTTGRYDVEQRRWACRTCWPHLLDWEAAIEAARCGKPYQPEPARLPGESRQAHRRRCREAQGGA